MKKGSCKFFSQTKVKVNLYFNRLHICNINELKYVNHDNTDDNKVERQGYLFQLYNFNIISHFEFSLASFSYFLCGLRCEHSIKFDWSKMSEKCLTNIFLTLLFNLKKLINNFVVTPRVRI